MAYYLEFSDASTASNASASINIPAWSVSSGSVWAVTVSFEITSLAALVNVIGSAATVSNRLHVQTNGTLTWSNVNINSAAGAIVVGTRYWVRCSGDASSQYKMELSTDGVTYSTVGISSTAPTISWNRLGQASSTRSRVLKFYSLEVTGAGSYMANWPESTVPSTGTSWSSVGATQTITLSSFSGPTDSWWVPYLNFIGTVPTQKATVSTTYSLDLSSYFSGTPTPYTYSVFSGTLPTGVTLNTSTGIISGTPTVQGKSPSVVIRATSPDNGTANTNAFNIGVGPWALRFSNDSQYLLIPAWPVTSGQDFEIEFGLKRNSGTAWLLWETGGGFSHYLTLSGTEINLRIAGNNYVKTANNANGSYSVIKIKRVANVTNVFFNGTDLGTVPIGSSAFSFEKVGLVDTNGSRMDLHYFKLTAGATLRNYSANFSDVFASSFFFTESGTNNAIMNTFTASDWVAGQIQAVASKPLKYYNGSTWVTKPLKYHNGTSWVEKPLKYHNGTSWT